MTSKWQATSNTGKKVVVEADNEQEARTKAMHELWPNHFTDPKGRGLSMTKLGQQK